MTPPHLIYSDLRFSSYVDVLMRTDYCIGLKLCYLFQVYL